MRGAAEKATIVVLTCNSDPVVGIETTTVGASDYVHKDDLSAKTLENVVRRAVERQRALLQIRDANEQLDRQNAELREVNSLLDRKNDELRAAKSLLDRKNKRLARLYKMAHQFVDNVSHDFRTPLTVIREYVSLMLDGLTGPVAEQHRRFLEIVNDRTDDLAAMVDDMLDMSRLDAGLLHVWRRPSNVRDVFEHVRPVLERKAELKKIGFTVSVDEGLPTAYHDPDKTGRVIVNLAVNAIKFGRPGGTVALRATHAADSDDVVIEIADDGPGIAPENLKAIYDRFRRVDTPTQFSTDGFGLGLSIAKELVHVNLGEIRVESELNRGTTFSFTVPTWNPTALVGRFLRRVDQAEGSSTSISLLVADVETPVESNVSDAIDEFLQGRVRGSDLVLRILPHKWLLLTLCPPIELPKMLEQVQNAWVEYRRNTPAAKFPRITVQSKGTWSGKNRASDALHAFAEEQSLAAEEPTGPRVLLVDDDREFVEAMEIRLRTNGYEVLTAFDGRSAVELARHCHPNAILLDNFMPIMGGLEMITELGNHGETMEIPIVMLSASSRDQQESLTRGASFFLQKPCDVGTLTALLREVIAEPIRAGVDGA
ncbi:MAG TPA: hypothetical protein DD670_05970 [Planctomycetaceae bacterium]|nr:hypothetical protein [Planctomycetaceae bacterium]